MGSERHRESDENFIIKRNPLVDETGRSTRTTRHMQPAPPCGAVLFLSDRKFHFSPSDSFFFLSDFISCNRSVDVGTHSRGRRRAEFAAARTCCSRAANWCPVSVRCQQPPRTVLSRLCSQAQSVDDTLMVWSLTLRHSSATIGRVIYKFFLNIF